MAVVDGGNGKLPEVYPHVTVYDDAGTITLYAGTITGKCKYCDWKCKRRGGSCFPIIVLYFGTLAWVSALFLVSVTTVDKSQCCQLSSCPVVTETGQLTQCWMQNLASHHHPRLCVILGFRV